MKSAAKNVKLDGRNWSKPRRWNRHPWDAWFSRLVFVLVRGRDYDCRTDSMASLVKAEARARGLRVSVTIADDFRSLTVGAG